jgi:hypothetical protein
MTDGQNPKKSGAHTISASTATATLAVLGAAVLL